MRMKDFKSLQHFKSFLEADPKPDSKLLGYDHPGINGECELVIGLDFGTSSSKVVIQAPDLPGSPSYAVDFGSAAHHLMPYLLPTRVWIDERGTASLHKIKEAKEVHSIKTGLFLHGAGFNHESDSIGKMFSAEEVAVTYLALLLRYCRKWFLETKAELLSGYESFFWSVNLGVPSPCVEDNEENRVFRRVGKAAWRVSLVDEKDITVIKAYEELKKQKELQLNGQVEELDTDCEFEIIPEIVAGAVGYAMSDLRRNGIHTMIDVGASTVDACSFCLNAPEGMNRYSLYIADVKPLGPSTLPFNRMEQLKGVVDQHFQKLISQYDPLVPMDEEFMPLHIPDEDYEKADDATVKDLKYHFLWTVRKVIWQTKMRRDPENMVWKKGQRLPIIVIGGGSNHYLYREWIEFLNEWALNTIYNAGIQYLETPIPDTLTSKEYKKLAAQYLVVPWGLSHRSLDIGELIPADQIPDVTPKERPDWRSRFISKDQV